MLQKQLSGSKLNNDSAYRRNGGIDQNGIYPWAKKRA
jgi:hypothetical protein